MLAAKKNRNTSLESDKRINEGYGGGRRKISISEHEGGVSDESSSSTFSINFLEPFIFLPLLDNAKRGKQ